MADLPAGHGLGVLLQGCVSGRDQGGGEHQQEGGRGAGHGLRLRQGMGAGGVHFLGNLMEQSGDAVAMALRGEIPQRHKEQDVRHFLNIVLHLIDFHSVSNSWVRFASSAGGAGEAEFCEVAG